MKPNSIQSAIRFAFGALSLGMLAACGGESVDIGGPNLADGGIRGTGSSVGPVSGFGSVFVNGVRFDTDGLNGHVESDDGISRESELDVGMILRVDGAWRDDGQGTARRVEYDDTLRGKVVVTQPWNPGTKTATLSVYGLVVHIDSQTVVKGRKATELTADLADGDFVRVSAWRLPNGEFRASFVRVLTDSSGGTFDPENEIELEGQIRDLDQSMGTFSIGNVTVQLLDGTEFEGINVSELANNLYIEVEGNFDSAGRLQASEIQEDDLRQYRLGDEEDIEFAGPVSEAFNIANSSFWSNGLTVRVTEDTDFADGLTIADLKPDLLIQVEGKFLEDGTVEAEEIELREGDAEVEGHISANEVFPDTQTFRIGGVLVQVTSRTTIIGEDDVRLGFDDLGGTQEVEVNGIERVTAEGDVYLEAFKVKVDDDMAEEREFGLVGRLREIDVVSVSVLGVRIELTSSTEFDDTNRDELQSMVDDADTASPLIEVEYRSTTGSFVADKIEQEDD